MSADIAALLGHAKPATNGLITTFVEATANVRKHEHPEHEDFYCLNLTSYMGERVAPVLRRLLDAEARVTALEAPAAVQQRAGYEAAIEVMRQEKLPMSVGLLEAQLELDALDGLVPRPLQVYRAEHPDSGIILGHYGTPAAARAHCEAMSRRETPGASLDWIEDDEDGIAELVAAFGEDERSTGYIVTALELAAEYDEEADE
jgi:hypothetical protein